MQNSDHIKILVVDDEPDLELLIRQKYRHQIKKSEISFIFAENGEDALAKLKDEPETDIVLTDINMPKMDGLTLLQHLPEYNPALKAIIVSAYGDMDNIRTAMNRGAFDFITKPINFADLEQTILKTFGYVKLLKQSLQALQENDILKMYVDKDVIRFMQRIEQSRADSKGEYLHATVAFFDICGFTAISEQFPPDTVVHLLNHFFDNIVPVIGKHEGMVDKFIGDSVMAVFKGENHEENGVKAALEIRDLLITLNVSESKDLDLAVSTGIHTGEMISGNIGSKTLKRFDYTVIGDVVNTASRLEELGKPNQIIISEPLFNKVRHIVTCEEIGSVNLKNKAVPQRVFNVTGFGESY